VYDGCIAAGSSVEADSWVRSLELAAMRATTMQSEGYISLQALAMQKNGPIDIRALKEQRRQKAKGQRVSEEDEESNGGEEGAEQEREESWGQLHDGDTTEDGGIGCSGEEEGKGNADQTEVDSLEDPQKG